MGGAFKLARTREKKNSNIIVVLKPEGSDHFGVRWKDNIKIHLIGIMCEGLDWICLAERSGNGGRALVNTVMCVRFS